MSTDASLNLRAAHTYTQSDPSGVLAPDLPELNALAVHPDLTYEHSWKPGELIVWDNRCLMHRATPYDPFTQRRVVRRCTVLGEVPS